MTGPSAKPCRYCGVSVTFSVGDGRWRDEHGNKECDGRAYGHRPSNRLTTLQRESMFGRNDSKRTPRSSQ